MRCLEDSGTEFSSVTAKTHTTESLSYLGATGVVKIPGIAVFFKKKHSR